MSEEAPVTPSPNAVVVETKTPETTSPEPKAEAEAPSLLNEAPEVVTEGPPEGAYEFKLPEGYELTEATSKEVNEMFKGMGLSTANAQKLMDYYVGKATEANEAPYKLWQDTQKGWVDEIKADPVLGKRLDEVRATASKAIDGLGDPKLAAEFRQALNITGAGNNPAFVRGFYRLAQQVTEGRHVAGRGPSEAGQQAPDAKPKSAAAALYPGLP